MATSRRNFINSSAMASSVALFPKTIFAARTLNRSSFTLWQLPLTETPTQGNSYVIRTRQGKVIVMDGGMPGEAGYLRGFVGALGNEVEAWFLSHPHIDHVGAINEILKEPKRIDIRTIYYSRLLPGPHKDEDYSVCIELYNNLEKYRRPSPAALRRDPLSEGFDENANGLPAKVVDSQPGSAGEIDGVNFKILAVKNEEITTNDFNNSCMIVKMWDTTRSVLFLGDAGEEEGEKVLNGPFRNDLDCDFLQMAHHGQRGVNKRFYQSIKFKACLWPTPRWLWNNDAGKGFNTGPWKTVETREWMKELGIEKHFLAADGLQIIE